MNLEFVVQEEFTERSEDLRGCPRAGEENLWHFGVSQLLHLRTPPTRVLSALLGSKYALSQN